MVNHYVFWNFKEDMTAEEKAAAGVALKEKFASLKDKIDGIISLEIKISELSSGNREIALLSVFESVEALQAYQIHPEHKKAGEFVASVTSDSRVCFDF